LIEVEGAPSEKVHTVLNGIDFDRVRLSSGDARERLRREFALGDGYLLLIAARLHPEKGHHFLFEALPEVRRRVSRPVKLLVAGTGPFETAYRDELRSLGCEDMITFLGFRKDSADLMAAADLVVLPSVAEAFGLVLTEAIYLGTPVVATRVGGIPEIVDDGVDGVLVPPADSKALSRAIADLLNDPDKRSTMAGAGRTKVASRFQFEKMMRAYESVYETVIDGRITVASRRLQPTSDH
jgi:glycosyltransferase involved in cell wall biosynthesis